jgi:MFS family permease
MSTEPTTGSRTRATIALLAFANLLISIDYNIVYVALPEIGRAVGFTPQSLQWVVSAYAVGYGGFLLLGGRTADRFGPRRTFVAGLILFGSASLVAALAGGPGLLVLARVVQGFGAALLFPATLALIAANFAEGAPRYRAISLWGVAGASGAVAGPLVGGVLTSALGWEWVFIVNVPLVAAGVVLAPRLLAADPPLEGGLSGFDVPGAVLATSASTLLVFGLVSGPEAGWVSVRGFGSMAAGAALLGAFLAVERRVRLPLMPSLLLGTRSLVLAMALIFVFMAGVNTMHYLFVVHLQDVLGFSAFAAGLAFLPMSVTAVLSSWKLLPRLLGRWGSSMTTLAAIAGASVAMAAIALGIVAGGGYGALVPGILMLGLSAGTGYPAVLALAGSEVPVERQGIASAMAATSMQVGGAIGLATLVAVANAGLDVSGGVVSSATETAAGLGRAGFAAAATVLASAVAGVLVLRRQSREAVREPVDATVSS